jgi:hypothetical protein
MYSIVRNLSGRQLVLFEVPALFGSLVVAEFFYKFHSFTLECLAFLATWFVLSSGLSAIARFLGSGSEGL